MKKKGFTLIELLAVIVVLAIVAVIAIPIMAGVVEKSRKGAAMDSALNYIRAIELKIATDSLNGINYENKEDYTYDEIRAKAKGKTPTGGMYTLYNNQVKNATFCINDYIVTYANDKAIVGEKCNGEDLKLSSILKLSKTSTFLTYPSTDEIEVIENTSGGSLTCSTSDSSIATCNINNNVITVTAGTKEGHATVTVTSEGTSKYKEANVALLVSTEEGLLSVTANGYTGVYDGNAHGITVTASGATIKYGTVDGTYDLTTSPTYSNAGEYTVYYEVIKEGYKTVTGNKTVSITKAEGSVTAPTPKTLTYTGSAQELINAGSSTTGTIQYKLGNGSYSTSIPTAIEAGTYTVYYKVIGDNNHNDVAEASINVTMIKRLQDVAQLGDYVIMTPTSTSSTIYTTTSQNATINNNSKTINPSLMNVWRVIKKNSDGTIEMVSEYVQGPITMGLPHGYVRYVEELQNAAAVYVNNKYTQATRYMGYNGQTLIVSYDSVCDSTPQIRRHTPEQTFDEAHGGGDTLYTTDTNLVKTVLGTLSSKDISDKSTASYYYLPSRIFRASRPDDFSNTGLCNSSNFIMFVTSSGDISSDYVFGSGMACGCSIMKGQTFNYYLRPIVTLKPNLEVSGGNGSSEANAWTLK